MKFWLSNKVNQEEALQALGRLFFLLERIDQQAEGNPDGLVSVTEQLWKHTIRPDIRKVREALNKNDG